jgi:hypothetical protein
MRPPPGSLALAAVAAIIGGYVLIERAPHLLHAAPEDATPEVAAAAAFPAGPQPRWAVDPTQTGSNLPPAGRSLFDFAMVKLVDGKLAYDIPFPFDALVRKVAERAGCAADDSSCIRQILIPLGRSLQRTAAAPDFFAYPRVVIAVDGEGSSGMLLKDRLYLGYQEKSALLEVISYNELAGRFEFQLVKDYRAGGSPRVVYANRNVCTACHQNLAPLFSRQQWDETNANPAVAQHLKSVKASFYGFPARRDIETPNAIDAAIHRANMLSVYQALWRDGCGDDVRQAAMCRRAALIAALQYRLSGERAFDASEPAARADLVATMTKVAAARWPNGMAIPNSEIPNRDPFGYRGDAAGVAMTNIAARFEPLAVRAPLEVWTADGERMAQSLTAGLAQMFSEQDIRLLDEYLARTAQAARAPWRSFSGRCEVTTAGADVRFRCRATAESTAALEGRVTLKGSRVDSGEVGALSLKGEPPLRLLDVSGGQLRRVGPMSLLTLALAVEGRRARLGSGNAIERIELRWQGEDEGEVAIAVSEDFAPLRQAITTAAAESALISPKSFARADVMAGLATALALPASQWCCTHAEGLPAAEDDANAGIASDAPQVADPFKKACSSCHNTSEHSPANFLHGDAKRVDAAVISCAPRMFVRLSMWDVARDQRAKVPMPPPRAAHDGMPPDREYGPRPEMLETLKTAAADIIRKETGREPDLRRLLDEGYENLRSCLPTGS